jgi:hypothetical protein
MIRFITIAGLVLILSASFVVGYARGADENSNLWPVHRDEQFQFRVSYPREWIVVPPKGRYIRFSVSPPDGSANCNIMAHPVKRWEGMSQDALNQEIDTAPTDRAAWAEYAGLPISKVALIESRRAEVQGVRALVAVLETLLENLQGQFVRKQTVAMLFSPGVIWAINCGASTASIADARARYAELQPLFDKIIGSFAFEK